MAGQRDLRTFAAMTITSSDVAIRDLVADGDRDEPVVGSDPVATIDDLAVTFSRRGRAVRALRGVTLSIARGEVVGLVGESGSGKTVLGLSLLGLLPSDPKPLVAGTAQVCGVDM